MGTTATTNVGGWVRTPRRLLAALALVGVPLAIAVLVGQPTSAQPAAPPPSELTLGWDAALPTQHLDDAAFAFRASGPCVAQPAFWQYRASWEDPQAAARTPYDHTDDDQREELVDLVAGANVEFGRFHDLPVGCDAGTDWTLPDVPLRGLERTPQSVTVTTFRDSAAGHPAVPLILSAPAAGQQVTDVTWTVTHLPTRQPPNPPGLPPYDTDMAEISFTTPTAATGTVITLTAPNGFHFGHELRRYEVEGSSLGQLLDTDLAVATPQPHVVTIALPETATVPAGERITVTVAFVGLAPAASYANTDFSVRTDHLPAPAHPERGVTVGDGAGSQTSVGEVRLTTSSREAGRPATWSYGFMTTHELTPLVGEITITAPAGTQLPPDPRAYSLAGVGLSVINHTNTQVTLQVLSHLPPLTAVDLRIDGVTNPPAGSYAFDAFSVRTNRDSRPAHPDAGQTFAAPGANAVSEVTIRPDDPTAGARTDWEVRFRTSSIGGLAGGSHSVDLEAPVGTVLPADPSAYTFGGAPAPSVVRHELHRVTLIVPTTVQASQIAQVDIAGVVNPGPEPLPVTPLAVDSPDVEVPVSCGLRWDPPSPWPQSPRTDGAVPVPFWDSTLANHAHGYAGNQLRCIAQLQELDASGAWTDVGPEVAMRTTAGSSDIVEDVLPFAMADGQFSATVRVDYEFWMAHAGTHPLVSTSADPDPVTPETSLDRYQPPGPTASVTDVWVWRQSTEQDGAWQVSFTTSPGGALAQGSGTITLEGPPGYTFPPIGAGGNLRYQVNGVDVTAGDPLGGGQVVELVTPVAIAGNELVEVEIEMFEPPDGANRGAFLWDEPVRCAGIQRQATPDPQTTPTGGCDIGRALYTDSHTSPVTLLLQPSALVQMSVLPYKIMYQPPGDGSFASFALTQTSSTSTEFAIGQGQQHAQAQNVYASVEHEGTSGLSFGPVGFQASFGYTDFWDTTTRSVHAEATQVTNSVTYEHAFTNAWETSRLGAYGIQELGDPGAQPWEHDQFILLVNPQFAVWNRGGTSVYQMIGTQASEWAVSARTLHRCADGVPLPVPGTYYDDVDEQIILSPSDCDSLIGLDPFARAERSSVDPRTTLGDLVTPLQDMAQGVPGAGTNGQRTITITETEAQSQATDQTTAFESQLTEIVGSQYAVSAGAKLEIEGLSGGYTLTGTLKGSQTEELTTTVNYRQSRTTASSISQSVSVELGDSKNPMITSLWLDSRWGTFAFQVPAPDLGSLTPDTGRPGTLLELTGTHFWAGPAWATFCPVDGSPCADGHVVDQLSDQRVFVVAPDLPPGTVAEVRAHGPGGPSAPQTFTYEPATGPPPGPGGGGGGGGPVGPPLDPVGDIAVTPFSGPAHQTHDVVLQGSGVEQALEVHACTFDGSACTALPAPEPGGDDAIEVTLPPMGPGTIRLVVVGPDGHQPVVDSPVFIYTAPGPTITSVTPATGPAAGGGSVVIAGTDLGGATRVRFGDVDAPFAVLSDGTIRACAPAIVTVAPTTVVPVQVTTGDGTSPPGDAALFTYTAEGSAGTCTLPSTSTTPQVTGVDPAFGPLEGGTPIRIEGRDFQATTEPHTTADGTSASRVVPPPVYVGGVAATDVRFISPAVLEAVVPAGDATGTVPVRVGGPGGLSPLAAGATFTYVEDSGCLGCDDPRDPSALSLDLVRPDVIGDGSDDVVQIAAVTDDDGHPVDGVEVTFGDGTRGVGGAVSTDRFGRARTVAGVTGEGARSLTATAVGLSSTAEVIGWPVPVVTAVTPLTLSADGGTVVTITGQDLEGATAVQIGSARVAEGDPGWGGVDAAADPQVLTVTAPPGSGRVSLRVANPAAASAPTAVSYDGQRLEPFTPGIIRIAGADRFATAAALSAAAFDPGVDVAYVATGEGFADALSGGVAAALDDAPMLLVGRDALPPATAAELDRLDPGRIVVLGGPAAVSDAVVDALAVHTSGGVTRLSGSDRFATSAAVSAATFPAGADTVYIATGTDHPDALAGVPAAAQVPGPVLLVGGDAVPPVVAEEITRLDPGRIVVLGGPAAVGEDVVRQLDGVAMVARLAGADRHATAGLVAAHAFPEAVDTVVIATGQAYPDALAGGAVAGAMPAPLLLTGTSALPEVTAAQLERLAPERIIILGGPSAVGGEVEAVLAALVG